MCDYSLMAFPNRLARTGEELIVYQFQAGSKGLASVLDLQPAALPSAWNCTGLKSILNRIGLWWMGITNPPASTRPVPAICIPPGTRLLLRDIPERLQHSTGVRQVEEVTFTQLSAEFLRHRDAVRFRNGRAIILQGLQEGQRARVLDMSSADAPSPEPELVAPVS